MAAQTLPRSIPLLISRTIKPEASDRIQEKFLAFNKANPAVYSALVAMARKVKATGRSKYAIETIFSVLRWDSDLSTSGDIFKLNNSMRSRYARHIMQSEPDLSGFFNVRTLTATQKHRQQAKS